MFRATNKQTAVSVDGTTTTGCPRLRSPSSQRARITLYYTIWQRMTVVQSSRCRSLSGQQSYCCCRCSRCGVMRRCYLFCLLVLDYYLLRGHVTSARSIRLHICYIYAEINIPVFINPAACPAWREKGRLCARRHNNNGDTLEHPTAVVTATRHSYHTRIYGSRVSSPLRGAGQLWANCGKLLQNCRCFREPRQPSFGTSLGRLIQLSLLDCCW